MTSSLLSRLRQFTPRMESSMFSTGSDDQHKVAGYHCSIQTPWLGERAKMRVTGASVPVERSSAVSFSRYVLCKPEVMELDHVNVRD